MSRILEGWAEKKGKRSWAARYLRIYGERLFIFRNSFEETESRRSASSISYAELPLNVIDIPFALIDYDEDCTIKLITHREVSLRSLRLLHSMNSGSPRRRRQSSGTRNCANSQGKARRVRKAQKAQAWKRKGVLRNAAIQKRTRKRNPSPKANHPEYKTLCEKATLPNFSFLPNICKPNSRSERSDEDEWRVHPPWRALPSPPKQCPIPLTEILSIPCLPRAAVAQHLPFLLVLQSETTSNLLRELSYATIKALFV